MGVEVVCMELDVGGSWVELVECYPCIYVSDNAGVQLLAGLFGTA